MLQARYRLETTSNAVFWLVEIINFRFAYQVQRRRSRRAWTLVSMDRMERCLWRWSWKRKSIQDVFTKRRVTQDDGKMRYGHRFALFLWTTALSDSWSMRQWWLLRLLSCRSGLRLLLRYLILLILLFKNNSKDSWKFWKYRKPWLCRIYFFWNRQ